MNRYQITLEELKYLHEMIEFLKDEGNSCSDEGSNQVKEVFDRISSRPVFDTVIDPQVFIDHGDYLAGKEENETKTNDKSE